MIRLFPAFFFFVPSILTRSFSSAFLCSILFRMPGTKKKKESGKQDGVHLSLLDREELLTCLERFHDKSFRGFQVRGYTITYASDLAKAFKVSRAAITKLWKLSDDKKRELHNAAAKLHNLPKRKKKAASKRIRVQVCDFFIALLSHSICVLDPRSLSCIRRLALFRPWNIVCMSGLYVCALRMSW